MNLTIWRLGGLKEQIKKQKRVVVAVKHGSRSPLHDEAAL
jgi:hypothetical protein